MMRLLYSFSFAFFVGYLGMNLWDTYERYQAKPIVYPTYKGLSQEDDLIARQHILEKEQREQEAGERLMEQHRLKHEAILNDHKR